MGTSQVLTRNMSLLLEKSFNIHEKCFAHPMILWLKLWQTTIVIMYECVDQSPQSVPGSLSDTNGALFYQTQDRILADLNFFYMAITLQTLILYTVTKLVDIVQRCKFKRQRGVSGHQWYIHCSSVSATVGASPLGSCWKSGGCLIRWCRGHLGAT